MKRFAMAALLLAGAACAPAETGGEAEPAPEAASQPATLTPGQIGALAAQIANAPESADSLLAANGLDAAQLDSIVYEIAADAEASAEYLAALNR